MKISGVVKYDEYIKGLNEGKQYRNTCRIEFMCRSCGIITSRQLRIFDDRLLCTKCSFRETNLERYGVEAPAKNLEIRNKQQSAFKKHYSDPEFKNKLIEKRRNTKLKRYGNPTYNNIEKNRKTKFEKYGDPTYTNFDKIKKTLIEKYGGIGSGSEEIRKKVEKTMLERYGDPKYGINHGREISWNNNGPVGSRQSVKDKIRSTTKERYGYDHIWKVPEIIKKTQEKIKKLNIEKYGVPYVMQVSEIVAKTRKKYLFDGIYFDSSWELAYFIWLRDNKIQFEYHTKRLKYIVNGKEHYYFPDFIVEGRYVEIKGGHLFNNGKLVDFYHHGFSKGHLNEKTKCMLDNNVILITDVTEQLKYVTSKYGRNYMKQFKTKEKLRV